MSDDLQFAALHSDDALLDALGGRVPGASLGVVAGVEPSAEPDIAAFLLAAFAEEIDTRPGPLTELLTGPVGGARTERPPAALEAVTPITHARRRRSLAMSRTASIVTAGALVLGFSGAAAALHHDNIGPLEGLKRTFSSMTGGSSASAARTPAERANDLLERAEEAMNAGDLDGAAKRLAEVQSLLPQISDPSVARTLNAYLDALRKRWSSIEPALAALITHNTGKATPTTSGTPTGTASPSTTYAPPANSTPVSGSAGTLVPGTGMVSDPTDSLTPVQGSPVGSAKDDLKNKAKDKLGHPLPNDKTQPVPAPSDLPAPVGGMRGPTGSPLGRTMPGWTMLYNYGGDALSKPDPAAVPGALTDGNAKHSNRLTGRQ